MDRLNRSNGSDGLSELLRSLRIRTTIFCRSDMQAPWGFGVKAHGRAAFHVLLDGSCRLEVDGVEAAISLGPGDLVVLPHGPGHTLRSDDRARVEWLDDILERTPPVNGRLRYGGHGARTDLICGVFEIENRDTVPILKSIPNVALVRSDEGSTWLGPLLDLIKSEVSSFTPGADSVVARIADILLLQAVRHGVESAGSDGAMFDSQVATTLRLMREQPDRAWTIDELAKAVSSSRSSLAERFRGATGMPPMRYLTRLRIASAARELGAGSSSLSEIAARVGYGSDAALSKAFLREMGVSPSGYRSSKADEKMRRRPSRPSRRRSRTAA